MLRLITIPISHFCEKARWALDRARLPYEEVGVLPVAHLALTWRYARHSQVPVLVHDGGGIGESGEILRWVDSRTPEAQRLFPEGEELAEVERWEQLFDRKLGPAARLLAYSTLLPSPEIFLKQMRQVYQGGSRVVLPAVLPLARAGIRRRYGVNGERAARARERCRQVLDEVAAALESQGTPYLVGERFTAADLTFAALAAPLVLPARYGGGLLSKAEMPEELQAIASEFGEHPAGKFALRIYELHR